MAFFLDLYGNTIELAPTTITNARTVAKHIWQCKIVVTDEDVRVGSRLDIQRHRNLFVQHSFSEKEDNYEELLFEIRTKDAGFAKGTHTFPLLWDGNLVGTIRIQAIAPMRIAISGHDTVSGGQKKFDGYTSFSTTAFDHKKTWMLFGIRSLYALVATLLFALLVCTGTGTYVCMKITDAIIEEMHTMLLKE